MSSASFYLELRTSYGTVRLSLRSRNLLHRAIARSSGSTKAHYQSLLMKINAALKDKL